MLLDWLEFHYQDNTGTFYVATGRQESYVIRSDTQYPGYYQIDTYRITEHNRMIYDMSMHRYNSVNNAKNAVQRLNA